MATPIPTNDSADDPLALFEPEEASSPAKPASAPKTAAPPKAPTARREEATAVPPLALVPEPSSPRFNDDLSSPPRELRDAVYLTSDAVERIVARSPEPPPVPRDVSVEVLGPPPPAGAVSFDHVCALKGLGFVEGVALIDATCAALAATTPASGVPDLHGLFLTTAGDVVPHGPPNGERPARELARLLHQLVTPNLMPPAGRLFVGRWLNNDVGGLTEFASELAYFARPNSRDLLVSLHARCQNVPVRTVVPEPRRPERPRQPEPPVSEEPQVSPPQPSLLNWARAHKAAVTVGIAVLAASVATALVTWIWQANAIAARKPLPPVSSDTQATLPSVEAPRSETPATGAQAAGNSGLPPDRGVSDRAVSNGAVANQPNRAVSNNAVPNQPNRVSNSAAPNRAVPDRAVPDRAVLNSSRSPADGGRNRPGATGTPAPPLSPRGQRASQPPTVIQSQDAAGGVPLVGPPLLLSPATTLLDLRIYSAADAGVEPPRLRSAKIPDGLIGKFPNFTNEVELIINERGEVQQVQMVNGPQRMPDIMLLSRVKELRFDPATRNGIPVPYRMRLSWNVNP